MSESGWAKELRTRAARRAAREAEQDARLAAEAAADVGIEHSRWGWHGPRPDTHEPISKNEQTARTALAAAQRTAAIHPSLEAYAAVTEARQQVEEVHRRAVRASNRAAGVYTDVPDLSPFRGPAADVTTQVALSEPGAVAKPQLISQQAELPASRFAQAEQWAMRTYFADAEEPVRAMSVVGSAAEGTLAQAEQWAMRTSFAAEEGSDREGADSVPKSLALAWADANTAEEKAEVLREFRSASGGLVMFVHRPSRSGASLGDATHVHTPEHLHLLNGPRTEGLEMMRYLDIAAVQAVRERVDAQAHDLRAPEDVLDHDRRDAGTAGPEGARLRRAEMAEYEEEQGSWTNQDMPDGWSNSPSAQQSAAGDDLVSEPEQSY
ncbi:MAG TPA: hypothetical protein VMV09_02250 [Candidatus Saccharimonadales bacterium]|nr:hypothetical protein [Candidatus Saccharimonadales bacterium]